MFWALFIIKPDILTKYYMKNILRPLITVAICFALMTVTSPSPASDYATNHKRAPAVQNLPSKIAQWDHTPTVILCEYAPVNKDQVHLAIKFWERLGYKFLHSQRSDIRTEQCNRSQPTGYITIHLVTTDKPMSPTALAKTHFYVNNDTNKIEWATIYMRADVKKTVLEHEFGHALGFLHFDRINHLMNDKWELSGWDTTGLESNQR